MSTTFAILLIGFAGLVSAGLVVLYFAIKHAVDGYENETGFYPTEPGQEIGLPRLIADDGLLHGLPATDSMESIKITNADSAHPFPTASGHGTLTPGEASTP